MWIDHDTFTDEPAFDKLWPPVFAAPFNEATQKVQHHDGQVDIVVGATLVTLTQNLFTAHDKTNLLGASDGVDVLTGYGPGKIDVTFHHNYWLNTIQRMPRVRFGRVHVYNDVYDLDWLATADYRLGDSWVAGTAGKLFAENNLFTIHNDSVVPASKIAAYSSTASNQQRCIDAGFTAAQCGTYFYEEGTVVTTVSAAATTTSILDVFAALKLKQESNASNALLVKLDPADPAAFWLPRQSYAYDRAPISTAEEQAALQQYVTAGAGAGHL